MSRAWIPLLLAGTVSLGSCDYNPDFLFADVTPIPSVIHLDGPDGEQYIRPAVINNAEEARAHTVYAEVGAPRTAAAGGVTLNFEGTGGDLCVWVDPELAFWNQRVGNMTNRGANWLYPDNFFDDGDLDLFVGLSAYYTGSEGEEMGDFYVAYTDSLGNSVPIELSACSVSSMLAPELERAHAGRGAPEYCTIPNTSEGISYTIALRTFSAPSDDSRLGFGLLLAEGSCNALANRVSGGVGIREECVITGEAIIPQGEDYGPWFGYDPARTWPGSRDFENAFCDGGVADFCREEALEKYEQGLVCDWHDLQNPEQRCFCGDPTLNPEVGAG